jgi:hypothetical protein
MADVRICEVGVPESSDIDSLSKQLIAREGFTPFSCSSDLTFYVCQMSVVGHFISKYYPNSVAVSCQTICTVLWLRTWELSILLLTVLSLDCFDTQEYLWPTTALKFLAAWSSIGRGFQSEPWHALHTNQRAVLRLVKAPIHIIL